MDQVFQKNNYPLWLLSEAVGELLFEILYYCI